MSSVQVDPLAVWGTLVALFTSYAFYKTYFQPTYLSPLRHIPGPPNVSKYNPYRLPFVGNFLDILQEEAGVPHRRWIEQYGGIVVYRGLFNSLRVIIADPKAISHVFSTNSYQYRKSDRVVKILSQVIGHGVLLAEGDAHRKQRKMLNPAFSHKHIKEMVPTMSRPAATLAKIWEGRVDSSEKQQTEFDITGDLGRATLDIIGLSGFGYDFQALTVPNNELSRAYRELFDTSSNLVQILRMMVPFYIDIPFKHNRVRKQAIRTIDRTTSVTVTWMLHIFSIYPDVQTKVRNEMLAHIGRPSSEDGSHPGLTYDALASLPYLGACVKELLRYIPPVPTTSRVAAMDDTILGYDIPKGTQVFMSPAALHKLKSIYGEDAEEFKPERWLDRDTATAISGEEVAAKTTYVTAEMNWAYQPFLSGPRNCIGSKFALIETKILLYYLLLNLEYHPAPGFTFKKAARVTWRPMPGMKLLVKRLDADRSVGTSVVSKEQ
ncbi:hypothetical protein BGZ92_011946 [Podila epicladia]|nr:hypothetical protein BGZ92_011946 [Podila epicladia]